MTPPAPNSGGTKGVIFSLFARTRLIVAINNTNETFNVLKKFVTFFVSLTPFKSRRTLPNDTKNAQGLIPRPGSNRKRRNWYHELSPYP